MVHGGLWFNILGYSILPCAGILILGYKAILYVIYLAYYLPKPHITQREFEKPRS